MVLLTGVIPVRELVLTCTVSIRVKNLGRLWSVVELDVQLNSCTVALRWLPVVCLVLAPPRVLCR